MVALMGPPLSISGLHAVTPDELDTKLLVAKVLAALKGGARVIHYRNKAAGPMLRMRQSTAILAACRMHGVPLIINGHLDLCAEIDADGVHLEAVDARPGPVKRLLGADKIIGVSCYNQLALAQEAEAEGATYATFGSCFPLAEAASLTLAPLTLFKEAKRMLGIPLVGTGGIILDNAEQVKDAGADAIAVTRALFDTNDIKTMAQQFNSIY